MSLGSIFADKVLQLASWPFFVARDNATSLLLYLVHLTVTIASILVIIVIVSLLKSLQPHYKFSHRRRVTVQGLHHGRTTHSKVESTEADGLAEKFGPRDVLKGLDGEVSMDLSKLSFVQNLSENIRKKSNLVLHIAHPALSIPDLILTHKQLYWSQTQMDVESVQWLNQALLTLWPPMRAILDKTIIKDLLKPKRAPVGKGVAKSKKEVRNKARPSVLLSSYRKLVALRKIEANVLNRYRNCVKRSAIVVVFWLLKVFLVYSRNFVLDYLRNVIARKQPAIKSEHQPSSPSSIAHVDDRDRTHNKKSPNTWPKHNTIPQEQRKFTRLGTSLRSKFESSPDDFSQMRKPKCRFSRELTSTSRQMARLKARRYELAKKLIDSESKYNKEQLTLEQVTLGNSVPKITGIKFIEDKKDTFTEAEKVELERSTMKDDSNMRLAVEVSYCSDKNFLIRARSVPIFETVKLTKLTFNLRLMLTLNHTTSELDKNLEIFKTPGDVLFPAINHVQVALVDVPRFDWAIERPSPTKSDKRAILRNSAEQRTLHGTLLSAVRNYLDPVKLVDHNYFKYIVHSMMYIALKWFQPFDIKIGPHFYLKSFC